MSIDKGMDKEGVVYTYNGILLSHKNECIWVSANDMDEPWAYYIEWSKSEREKQISYFNAYLCNLERQYWWTYLQGSNGDADIENRLVDTGPGGQMEKTAQKHIQYRMENRRSTGTRCMIQGTQMRLSDNPEGWGRKREGDSRRRGHTYTYVDSCWCMTEINTIL